MKLLKWSSVFLVESAAGWAVLFGHCSQMVESAWDAIYQGWMEEQPVNLTLANKCTKKQWITLPASLIWCCSKAKHMLCLPAKGMQGYPTHQGIKERHAPSKVFLPQAHLKWKAKALFQERKWAICQSSVATPNNLTTFNIKVNIKPLQSIILLQ